MKCVKNQATEQIQRVSNDQAKKLVATGEWRYICKLAWKQLRNAATAQTSSNHSTHE